MLFYSGGFTALFFMFGIQYVRAYKRRDELELEAQETLITRSQIRAHFLSMGIGLLSIAIVLLMPGMSWLGGAIYFLMGPLQAINGFKTGNAVKKLAKAEEASPQPKAKP